MKIEVTAPGKALLHGEHAVVYGKAGIAVSLSLRTSLTLVSHEENTVVLKLNSINLIKEWDLQTLSDLPISAPVGEIPPSEECLKDIMDAFEASTLSNMKSESHKLAVITFLYLWIHIFKSYNFGSFLSCVINLDSELSVGSGMGSSASYSVCLSAALLVACGRITPHLLPEDRNLVNKWAFEAEKIFHGKPSGIDNSICTHGGALLFENGVVVDVLPELHNINILLVNTNEPRNTKKLVAAVRLKQEKYPAVIDPIMEAIHSISLESWKLLKSTIDLSSLNEQMQTLQDLVKMNQHLLNSIGAGHAKLDKVYEIARQFECTAKLTGAGGGGCAIVLLPFGREKNKIVSEDIKTKLLPLNCEAWEVYLGCPGVQVKCQNDSQ